MAMRGMRVGLCSVSALIVAGAVGVASAQDMGGITFEIGVSERLEYQRATGTDSTTQALTGLTFGYRTETRNQRLAFSGGVDLRVVNSSTTDGFETEVLNPSLGLAYSRTAAASSLSFSANYIENDISFLRPLSDFVDGDGIVSLPDDFSDLSGTGTRQQLSYSGTLTLRDDRPFGISLSVSGSELNYRDTTDPDLTDSSRFAVGLGFRFDISDVTSASLEFNQTRLEDAAGVTTESLSVASALTIARPTGSLTFGLRASDTGAGTQVGASIGRELDLSETDSLSAELGVTRSGSGENVVTGSLSYRTELPQGVLSTRLRRTVSVDADNEEQVVTSLSGGYSTALSESLSLSLSGAFARTSETATNIDTDIADLGLQISYDLTRDWALSAGVSRQWRSENSAPSRTTDTLSIGLSRTFQWRY